MPSPSKLQPDHACYSGYSEAIFDATSNPVCAIRSNDRVGDGSLMQTKRYDGQSVDTRVVTLASRGS